MAITEVISPVCTVTGEAFIHEQNIGNRTTGLRRMIRSTTRSERLKPVLCLLY